MEAVIIHSISWKASHCGFCSADFIELYTPEHKKEYLLEKIRYGSMVNMLNEDGTVGIVSVTVNFNEDLYVLPDKQKKGYETRLLLFAIGKCTNIPMLWIIENNEDAERIYRRLGSKRQVTLNP